MSGRSASGLLLLLLGVIGLSMFTTGSLQANLDRLFKPPAAATSSTSAIVSTNSSSNSSTASGDRRIRTA